MAQFRRATSDLRNAVNEEVHQHQEFAELKEFSSSIENEVRDFGTSTQEYLEKEIENEEKELEKLGREITENDTEDDTKDDTETPPPVEAIPSGDYGPNLDGPGVDETADAIDGTPEGGSEEKSDSESDNARKETA